MLGLIRRNTIYKETDIIVPLYKAIVKHYSEYYKQAWKAYCKKNIYTLAIIANSRTERP